MIASSVKYTHINFGMKIDLLCRISVTILPILTSGIEATADEDEYVGMYGSKYNSILRCLYKSFSPSVRWIFSYARIRSAANFSTIMKSLCSITYLLNFNCLDDVSTSGIWPRANELAENKTALKDICLQAYDVRWPYRSVEVLDAKVGKENLTFMNMEYDDIDADMLICTLAPAINYLVVTKGMGPECVFQCRQVDPWGPRMFRLSTHICGIEM